MHEDTGAPAAPATAEGARRGRLALGAAAGAALIGLTTALLLSGPDGTGPAAEPAPAGAPSAPPSAPATPPPAETPPAEPPPSPTAAPTPPGRGPVTGTGDHHPAPGHAVRDDEAHHGSHPGRRFEVPSAPHPGPAAASLRGRHPARELPAVAVPHLERLPAPGPGPDLPDGPPAPLGPGALRTHHAEALRHTEGPAPAGCRGPGPWDRAVDQAIEKSSP
ncbi:hypothetical protein GCM10020229_14450 [Kitasatospora albolonga]